MTDCNCGHDIEDHHLVCDLTDYDKKPCVCDVNKGSEERVTRIVKTDQDSITIDRGMKGNIGFSIKVHGDLKSPEFIEQALKAKADLEKRLGIKTEEIETPR